MRIERWLAAGLMLFALGLGGCGSQRPEVGFEPAQSLSGEASEGEGQHNSEIQERQIRLEVVVSETDRRSFSLTGTEDTLGALLKREGLIDGEESSFGLFVTTVDGITADERKQEWWCLTKEGAQWNYGVDDTQIEDGDAFEWTLETGY